MDSLQLNTLKLPQSLCYLPSPIPLLPSGLLGNKFNARKLLAGSVAVWSVATALPGPLALAGKESTAALALPVRMPIGRSRCLRMMANHL